MIFVCNCSIGGCDEQEPLPLDDRYPEQLEQFEKTGRPDIQTGDAALDELLKECIRIKPEARPTMRQFEEKTHRLLEEKREKEALSLTS
jgi:hypothetical protein